MLTVAGLGILMAVPHAGTAAAALPTLSVTTVVSGLSNPWDLTFTPSGFMLFTERGGKVSVRLPNGTVRRLAADMSDLWVSGETGLMGIEVDPDVRSNRRVYTCQGTTDNDDSVQVVAWTIDTNYTRLTRVKDPLVGNIDGNQGRHGGCQLRFDKNGYLFVGTGDAAVGTNPQNRNSLAGKTLRVNRFTGAGIPGNAAGGDPRVYTYGHRNVQGLALSAAGAMYSVEHGPDRDDEINLLAAGRNFGWDPIPGYNEDVPMTNLAKFPNATRAVWSSGFPTLATSGATFLVGSKWGALQNYLAVCTLKGESLRLIRLGPTGVIASLKPAVLAGRYGRLRGAELGPDGNLYLTTSNGSGDRILRVTPH